MGDTATLSPPSEAQPECRTFLHRLRSGDEIAHILTLLFASAVLVIVGLLVIELYRNSVESRAKFGWAFFFTRKWDPIAGQFGALPFIYGTVVTSALAPLIAVPVGVGEAIFLQEVVSPTGAH